MTPMVVQCSSCLTEFELDPAKIPDAGVRARCSVCSAVIVVPPPPEPMPASTAAPAAGVPAQSGYAQNAYVPRATPAAGVPVPLQPEAPTVQWGSHSERTATSASSATSAATVAPPPAQSAPSGPPAQAAAPAPAAQPTQPAQPSPGAPAERRPINPFLSRDPALRAKRLARALVSDIVAYHPARHAEGLRDGTLKTLFRDEIKKSYEEYVDQVGRDFAQSTTHFQDALNDVLAGGKKLF